MSLAELLALRNAIEIEIAARDEGQGGHDGDALPSWTSPP